MSLINFNFLENNVKGMQSSKKRLNQFEYFKRILKTSGLLFLQETHSTVDYERKWNDDFGGEFESFALKALYGNQEI